MQELIGGLPLHRDGAEYGGHRFELRKLVETKSIRGFLGAAFSGIFIVAGPWLISTASVAWIQCLPFLASRALAASIAWSSSFTCEPRKRSMA